MKKIKLEKHIKIKLFISIALIGLLVLSFFFSNKLETALGLSGYKRKHQLAFSDVSAGAYSVSYFDVGQGNSALIKLPDDKTVLIDAGDAAYGETVAENLKLNGVSTIDYLIATHSDSDHIGGMGYIFDNFEIKCVIRPFQIAGTGTNKDNFVVYEHEELGEIYNQLMIDTNNQSKMSRVTTSVYKEFIYKTYTETFSDGGSIFNSLVVVSYDGLVISGENYEIKFYAPLKRENNYNLMDFCDNTIGYATIGYGVNDPNNNSAIFTVKCFDDTYLFSGDATFNDTGKGANDGEDDFVESLTAEEIALLDEVDVFLLGHHGSKYSSGTKLLSVITPRFVVVSSGHEFGHPADETLERVSKLDSLEKDYLVRTDEFGTITFSNIGGKIMYSLERSDRIDELTISYVEIASIVTIAAIFVIFSVKPRKRKEVNFVDITEK